MAWQTNADGSKRCTLCDANFRPPRSCNCPHEATRAPGEVVLGSMESMTAQAKALGLLDRLGLEQHLADRIGKADREANAYRRHAKKCLDQGVERNGPDGPIAADADAAAVKWCALAESARGRADKVARALLSVVSDRERRADLERQERLAEAALGKAKPTRGAN